MGGSDQNRVDFQTSYSRNRQGPVRWKPKVQIRSLRRDAGIFAEQTGYGNNRAVGMVSVDMDKSYSEWNPTIHHSNRRYWWYGVRHLDEHRDCALHRDQVLIVQKVQGARPRTIYGSTTQSSEH